MNKEDCGKNTETSVTKRVRLEIKDGTMNVNSLGLTDFYTLTILESVKFALINDSDKIESIERNILDFSNPFICIAYNSEDGRIQLAINDIAEGLEVGVISALSHIVIRSILGINGNNETLEKIKELLG